MIAIPSEHGLLEWEIEGGSLADLARADETLDGWPRIRFKHSAVAWSRRPKLLGAAESYSGPSRTRRH
ncbi:hypothetical protein [Sphingomonas hankyongi]|uniref:Uncharacterized protein n=1 Tax=Sphingomonas hankyongi TaxID=2908209 RepID=A0ABT0S286_9SPHN|nr:hypothetical protein [Sphingomonas hankyongi]MCL6729778.1 hypothetical protein [Sphingomonas hankyongi]